MLFHMSCKAAAQGRTVVWLCSQARMEQSAPLLPSGVHRSNPILSSIAFKWVGVVCTTHLEQLLHAANSLDCLSWGVTNYIDRTSASSAAPLRRTHVCVDKKDMTPKRHALHAA